MAELDHLIFASPDVDAGVQHIENLTGARAVAGGPHVGLGTHNALLTFDERTYFEVIGIDPDQPDPDQPRPFGLDDRNGPGLAGYAVHPSGGESLEDLRASMLAAGFDPGSIADMSRRLPDGELISWRLTIGGDSGAANQGALPFAIDWGDRPSPAASLPSMGRLVSLRVSHPDAAIRASVEALGLVSEVVAGPAGLVATVDSPNGTVEIS
ncbi:MAG: VOC family protein [Acidimicrobiales bacterium]